MSLLCEHKREDRTFWREKMKSMAFRSILIAIVMAVLVGNVESLLKEDSTDKSRLTCLCGDSFIQAYKYCCQNHSQCQAMAQTTSKRKRSILDAIKLKGKFLSSTEHAYETYNSSVLAYLTLLEYLQTL